jgi:D-xylose transport system permease protein
MTTVDDARARTPPDAAVRARRAFAGNVSRMAVSMLAVFVVLAIFFHLKSDGIFFTPRNLSLLLRQAAYVAILAGGVSVLMVMREIDLSIGSAVFLAGVVAAKLNVDAGWGVVPTVIVAIGAGVALGAWQGFWVVKLAVPSFIVTLAGLLAFRGIGLLWTNAATVAPLDPSFVNLSERFIGTGPSYAILAVAFAVVVGFAVRRIRHGRRDDDTTEVAGAVAQIVIAAVGLGLMAWIAGGFLGIPNALVWVAAVGLLLVFVMRRTRFGRNAYMIGSNREASEFAGINVQRHLFIGFALMGMLYGVAGVLLTARLAASTPGSGEFLELDAIAAAVIGGTALSGGIGTVQGAMAGALLLATIDNGMSLLNVSSFAQQVVKGGVLLGALALNAYLTRRR